MFGACAMLFFMLMYAWVEVSGLLPRFPFLVGSDIPIVFLGAPAFYLTALTILHEGKKPVGNYGVHFILPALFAFGSCLYNAVTVSAYLREFGVVPGRFSSSGRSLLSLAAILWMVGTICSDLFMARRLHASGRIGNKREFFGQVFFLCCYLISAFICLVAVVLRHDRLFLVGYSATGIIAILFVFTRTTVFYATQDYALPIRPAFVRPEWDSSSDELTARLTALMGSASPYRDPDLSLGKLADMLQVDPKRLSYHLHANLSISFRSYINEWRLRAICRDLGVDSHRSILDIAFENGFNSKSSFNTLFVKKYGMTPKEFRKRNRACEDV
jgi:AraC-like DNA-binding protein